MPISWNGPARLCFDESYEKSVPNRKLFFSEVHSISNYPINNEGVC